MSELQQYLEYFSLDVWWETELTTDEQNEIIQGIAEAEVKFKGFFTLTPFWDELSDNKFIRRFKSPGGWVPRLMSECHSDSLTMKIAKKAKFLLDQTDLQKLQLWEFSELHFDYQGLLGTFYSYRDKTPGALEDAIACAKSMIYISPQVIKDPEIKIPPDGKLPAHRGYEQLAIIAEKQKNFAAAIKISTLALSQEWDGDWEWRIERCEKKMAKEQTMKIA